MDKQAAIRLLQRIRSHTQERKQADDVLPSQVVQEIASQQLQEQARSNIGGMARGAIGAGVLGGGLVGLYNLIRRNMRPPMAERFGPTTLTLPYPVKRKKEKTAGLPALSGADATSVTGIPWYRPGMMLAGLGGGLAGWKAINWLMERRRKDETKNELESARQEFHDTLLEQYQHPLPQRPGLKLKAAGTVTVEDALDSLYDTVLEKMAGIFDTMGNAATSLVGGADNMGGLMGYYGAYAAPAALLTGALVYDKVSKRGRREVLRKALQRRQRNEYQRSPPEMFAVPEPVPRE